MAKTPAPDRLTISQVAVALGKRYHKARDLVFSGKLGEPVPNEQNRLTVARVDVERYAKEHPRD